MTGDNQRRLLSEEAIADAWDFIAEVFQNFVLTFQNLKFTKGKRRLLLFLIVKAEGDIFQELRDYDRAIKAYKVLQSYCEIWQLSIPLMQTIEQIGLCYRLMRIHRVASDCYKKEL
jgi:hypothetical protein